MKKLSVLLIVLVLCVFRLSAQEEEENGLQISGSVDTYWKYDFSGYKNDDGISNIGTSFADEQNSISIGMIDIALSQTVGKASFVGEFSFGPRSFKSIPLFQPDGDADDVNVGIQNLYASYAFSDVFSLTAGYMGTFVGYEVISPAANFNYSTSYLFTSGPFQNSGIKADFTISDRFAFMVGLFNDWNVYQDFNGISDFGAQLYFMPVDGWDIYLNFITGNPSGTEIDLTTGWQITDAFYLGLNA
ncbi:MAG: outer membrane beta-barrel protein, partial [Cyclobacteriaceae bacterium]|nr:outer membrane beta-barrel protein [Cyclobacteriaceae bacterium]